MAIGDWLLALGATPGDFTSYSKQYAAQEAAFSGRGLYQQMILVTGLRELAAAIQCYGIGYMGGLFEMTSGSAWLCAVEGVGTWMEGLKDLHDGAWI